MNHYSRKPRVLVAAAFVVVGAPLIYLGCNVASRPTPKTSSDVVELKLADVTPSSGFEFTYDNGQAMGYHVILEALGGGLGAFDYDGDGRYDVFSLGGGQFGVKDELHPIPSISGQPSALFRNLGHWKFTVVTDETGLGQAPFYTHGCSAADFNNDGFTDILVTGYGGLQFFQNQGDGRFIEIRERAGLLDDSWSASAGWGDLNGDGDLDLYVTHYLDWSFAEGHNPYCPSLTPGVAEICPPRMFSPLPHIVYYSNGDGTFRDCSGTAGLVVEPGICGRGLGVIMGDVDLDGDLDMYVANDTDPNFLYVNDGSGVFREIGLLNGVACDEAGYPEGSMGVDLGDFNGDGLPDIWVTNLPINSLYRNHGHAQFLHVSQPCGITALGRLYVGFGTVFADVNRDGREDLVVSNGHIYLFPQEGPLKQEPLILINNHGHFEKAVFPPGEYFSTPHLGRGLAMSDFDDDGDLDFVFSHNDGEPNTLISNEIVNNNGWLRVRLIGTVSNRDAIGAWLVLHTSVGDQLRLVKGGGSYLSQGDMRPFWGLPHTAEIQGLSIHWPAGHVQEFSVVAVDETLVVIEPCGAD